MRTYEEIAADAGPRSPFSNSTEFEIWASNGRACYDCLNDGIGSTGDEPHCPILSASLLSTWPKEWTVRKVHWEIGGESGSYDAVGECIEFEERRDDDGDDEPDPEPGPPPVIEGQVDPFEVFADDVAEQAGRVAVPA